ncbi:TIGR03557 family F420-dependent LLM class oxidoreductase [Allosaccharopolyspora coralli]|uniref:TIGR03557 family F420-dependent LLM class oxidoreductase n=1 Tax=Allosaccharopolyspora coralli TaxID=2665642 RepID=A0A5Q3QGV1_9PSEU|nr:TIGR03557 family F420-dependent LLM class oxidoreductase [Allosaccharopolyspora coralli]QGK70689.1 TIGR03557 family F420-dependent LLM class oxidoreductase [Allosaccharopolyspora coralli]
MVRIGYFLATEEFGPDELVRQARRAEQAGFQALWISDHFHPWLDEQGNSPFVWSVIGALSQATSLPIATAVTCPMIRIHPAIVAQAAATAGVQTGGKFVLGLGTGEALNEHVLGDRWPAPPVRQEMLEEAIDVIRTLHRGGYVHHHGTQYTVENARLYTLPEEPVPIYVSAFGPKAARLAGRIGEGLCLPKPDADLVSAFQEAGGKGRTVQAGMKVCWADSEQAGVEQARTWANETLPGPLAVNLPTPKDFRQAVGLVGDDAVRESFACGPDVERHVREVQTFDEAGVDELYVQQIGPEQEKFFEAWQQNVLPHFHG